jgi:hypothetical protein
MREMRKVCLTVTSSAQTGRDRPGIATNLNFGGGCDDDERVGEALCNNRSQVTISLK